MKYLLECLIPEIWLGDKRRVTKKGEQFEIEDSNQKDLLLSSKVAIDITPVILSDEIPEPSQEPEPENITAEPVTNNKKRGKNECI